MTTAIAYTNQFDEALSYLVSYPKDVLSYLNGNKIEYLALVVDKAHNAGIDLKSIASILMTVNDQFMKVDLSKSNNVDMIFKVIRSRYPEQEASNDND